MPEFIMHSTRREFLKQVSAAGVLAGFAPAPGDIQFGYAAITWQGDDLKAIEDIAAVGFRGIQLRSNILKKFGDTPAALRDILQRHRLPMAVLSSGNLRLDPRVESEELARHTKHARFVRDVGGSYLQVIDERPKQVQPADYPRLGKLMTELGKRTADVGIPLVYHHHMNSLGERPEEITPILDAADPRYVKLLLDVAHYLQGGGDPVKAIAQYADRLTVMHIKDVESPVPGAKGDLSRSYRFVELGRGKVNLKGVFDAWPPSASAAGPSSSSIGSRSQPHATGSGDEQPPLSRRAAGAAGGDLQNVEAGLQPRLRNDACDACWHSRRREHQRDARPCGGGDSRGHRCGGLGTESRAGRGDCGRTRRRHLR